MYRRLVSFVSLLPALAVVRAQSSGPTVDLGYAIYQGAKNSSTSISSFLGIPYAAPPTGDLRFQAPQAPAVISDVQQATAQPNECYQAPFGNATTSSFPLGHTDLSSGGALMRKRDVGQSEDCLYLNVYTPADLSSSTNASLPVLVWIHGGGYVAGGASGFDGVDIVQESANGLVVVIIQYRLGVFGFLSGNEVVNGGGALNAGLLDQTYALEWVQSQISKFGGDPSQVTIWGESAGAGSVLQHIIANGGNTQPSLFRAAMTSSTFLPSQYAYNDTVPEALFAFFANGTGCSTSTTPLACIRNASVDTLESLNNQANLNGFYGTFVTVPVIDYEMIVERPIVTLQRGSVNGEVLLAMTNTHEGNVFVNYAETLNTTSYVENLFPLLPESSVQQVVSAYANYTVGPGGGPAVGDVLGQAIGIMGESIFYCPSYYLLDAFSKSNKSAWKGTFAIPDGFHSSDIPYYFVSVGPAVDNTMFIASFSGAFTGVALAETPDHHPTNVSITPEWTTWPTGEMEVVFNTTEAGDANIYASTTDTVYPGIIERCNIWHSLGQYTGQ
ncbi:alpha beta-hydrolase [Coniophora puteana RWD-64-598 SS2]|uniref:Carboxylic ester hydrolase n=1 Tax=Coniophora puteana (strain RWD-64-598) TaxID=741705 RepID=A0A5M3MGH5_CONPW|nr:alpha beta-hydrolase [Coniophora puteana RWD-64-598 SS2]EIW78157.1 alpha beta-hydrolase [Coniophora puteana RWD-64-598 SS2]